MTDINPQSEAMAASPLPNVSAEIEAIYNEIDSKVAERGPVCELSGRCCRFQEYGHTLFVSDCEFQYLISHAPTPVRPLDEGKSCPWQDERNRCVARDGRPLGCRVYFCDPTYDAGHELSEQFVARLKRLSDQHGLPWSYAPLHRHLARARDRIAFPTDVGAVCPD